VVGDEPFVVLWGDEFIYSSRVVAPTQRS
jgi:UTP-glucose-1-phosphate uridylyltransferase